MKAQKYVPQQERDDIVKLSIFSDALRDIANRTPVGKWRGKLGTASTFLKNIVAERKSFMDAKELEKVEMRYNRTNLLVYTYDECKMLESKLGMKDKTFKVDADNWVVMCQAIDNFICRKCKQGDKVKNCEIRKVLHKSFAPVYTGDPKEGECEFHWDSKHMDLDIEVEEDE